MFQVLGSVLGKYLFTDDDDENEVSNVQTKRLTTNHNEQERKNIKGLCWCNVDHNVVCYMCYIYIYMCLCVVFVCYTCVLYTYNLSMSQFLRPKNNKLIISPS